MRRMTLYAVAMTCAVILTLSAWVGAQGKKDQPITIKAKSVATRGADPNIKQAEVKNVAGKPAPAPRDKGGKVTRGSQSMGTLHIDSRSGYYIDVYLDGRAVGTVGPWGDLYIRCTAASWEFYATAPGTPHSWGPRTISIPADTTVHTRLSD